MLETMTPLQIKDLDIHLLRPFKNHPFKVVADYPMVQLKESIAAQGILSPLIVRPMENGMYEIISGHRRKAAAEQLGLKKVPAIIRELSYDDAVLIMVDANLQRELISPSEKAFACPVCGKLVYEGQKNYYCSNHECDFVLWKENRYLEKMKKKMDGKLAAELLKSGRATVNDFYSYKKDKYFEADLIMEYRDGRVYFSMEFPDRDHAGKGKKRK